MQVDLTAVNPANLIQSEHATPQPVSGSLLIIPENAPFYGQGFSLSVLQSNGVQLTLTKGIDYELVGKWHKLGLAQGGVYSAVFITNKTLEGQWFVQYQALGGNAVIDVRQFISFFSLVAGKYDVEATQSVVNPNQNLTVTSLKDYVNVQTSYAALPIIAEYYLADQSASSDGVITPGQDELQQLENLANQAMAIAQNAARVAQAAQLDVVDKYELPLAGIGRNVLSLDVQASLAKADSVAAESAPVTSVNGKTGAVNLVAADISGLGTAAVQQASSFATAAQGAKADTALQTLQQATRIDLGAVKIGAGVDLDQDGTISVTLAGIGAATAAQGAKADTALQVAPVASVAGRVGAVVLQASDIGGLGSAALAATTTFASAAQGTKADNAVQTVNGLSGNVISLSASDVGALSVAASDARYATAAQGTAAASAVQAVNGHNGNNITLTASDVGALSKAVADGLYATAAQGAKADTALQAAPVLSVNGHLGIVTLVASDISGLGSAATQNATSFATATQGDKADSSVQSVNGKTGSNVTLSASDVGAMTQATADVRYATAAQGNKADTALQVAPVASVAGRTGAITLTISDVGGLGTAATQNATSFATATQGDKADAAVQSVNGKTGNSITLTASDVGAMTQTTSDLRYVRTVNGVAPDASGNVVVSGGGGGTVTDFDGGTF